MTESPLDDMNDRTDAQLRALEIGHGPGRWGVAAMTERLAREAKAAESAARIERARHDELVDQIQKSAAPHWSTVPLFWIGLIGLVATVVLSVASLIVSLKSLELQRQPAAASAGAGIVPSMAQSAPAAIASSPVASRGQAATAKVAAVVSAGTGRASPASGVRRPEAALATH